MTAKVETALHITITQLRKGMNPDAIYLFGSHARGDAQPDSDLDLVVLIGTSDQPRYKRAQQARKVATDRSIAKDILVYTHKEWERGLKVAASLPTTVVREGKLVYER